MAEAADLATRRERNLPEQADLLEIGAHGVTAVLATWLGLVVLTRAHRRPAARVFGVLTLYLVIWSLAILVNRLTADPGLYRPLVAVEDVAAFLLPAGTLHIALSLTVEGRRSTAQQAALVSLYVVSAAMAALAVVFPEQKFAVSPPHFELPGVPGEVFGWAWIALRVGIFAAAHYWIIRAMRDTGGDPARRGQLAAALAVVFVGSVGGILRILPATATDDPAIGVSLVTLALVLAAYAVFSQGLFLSAEIAGQAFRYSLLIGLGVLVYVGVLIGLETVSRQVLAIELPVVTGLALVVTIALVEPVSRWLRGMFGGRSASEAAYDRLLQAMGQDLLVAQRPEDAIAPALARLTRTFGLKGAVAMDAEGQALAAHGDPAPSDPLAMWLPLRSGGTDVGTVAFGPKRSELPFSAHETEPLALAAGYLAASLRLARQQVMQAEALETLSEQRAAVETRETALGEALTDVSRTDGRLHVFGLGPMRVERAGALVTRWGGAKAGTRQAEAVFAFLFDRGERGATKDEIVELIWPDVDLDRADIAFHRTLGGLRSTLEPARRGGNRGTAIIFHNDRYRLDPGLIAWSDVATFEEEMAAAGHAGDADGAIGHLERARSLYRGDYLDDCPFYGDSFHVEERREMLRGRFVDLLLALGARHEERNDRPAAAACYRHARAAAGGLSSADDALVRLGSPA